MQEWMLEVKLAEMSAHVFKFVIGEAAYSNSNKPRKQCFPSIMASNPKIAQYADQIIYVYIEEKVDSFVYWEAEDLFKNGIGMKGGSMLDEQMLDDDIAVFTDLDEVLSGVFLYVLQNFDGFSLSVRASMRWSYYGFQWVNPAPWNVDVAVSWKDLRAVGFHTNDIRASLAGHPTQELIFKGVLVGWHCSWCMPTERFIHKIENTVHSEMNTEANKKLDFLESMRQQGLWFVDQQPNACYASLRKDVSIAPEYVIENSERFAIITH